MVNKILSSLAIGMIPIIISCTVVTTLIGFLAFEIVLIEHKELQNNIMPFITVLFPIGSIGSIALSFYVLLSNGRYKAFLVWKK